MTQRDLEKAALRGEPSYVWRAGQERRLEMIKDGGGQRLSGRILDCGCGIGAYLIRLAKEAEQAHGLEFDRERARQAKQQLPHIIRAASEALPYPNDTFDLILSHEVLEHVEDDGLAVSEMVRALKTNGRLILFAPNRSYPFETHGVFWRGRYHFGNIPLVNYLPNSIRNRLAPHVRAYTANQLAARFEGLPVRLETQTVIFGSPLNPPVFSHLIEKWIKSFP